MSEPCRLRRGEGYGACDDEGWNTSPSTRTLMGLTSILMALFAASAVTDRPTNSSMAIITDTNDSTFFFIFKPSHLPYRPIQP